MRSVFIDSSTISIRLLLHTGRSSQSSPMSLGLYPHVWVKDNRCYHAQLKQVNTLQELWVCISMNHLSHTSQLHMHITHMHAPYTHPDTQRLCSAFHCRCCALCLLCVCSTPIRVQYYNGLLVSNPLLNKFLALYHCPTMVRVEQLDYVDADGDKIEMNLIGDPTNPAAIINDGSYSGIKGQPQTRSALLHTCCCTGSLQLAHLSCCRACVCVCVFQTIAGFSLHPFRN